MAWDHSPSNSVLSDARMWLTLPDLLCLALKLCLPRIRARSKLVCFFCHPSAVVITLKSCSVSKGETAAQFDWGLTANPIRFPSRARFRMTPRITHRLGHEVLQPSALHDFEWPQTDPILSPQSARIWTEKDDNLVDAAVRNTNFRWESFLDDTCKLSVADQLWRLLTHRVFNFNGVTAVRGETYWADRVRAAVANSQPVDISYPL